jgi:uncharacterized protein YggT (Ycf19 family)
MFLPPLNLFFMLANVVEVLVLMLLVDVVISWGECFGDARVSHLSWVKTLRAVTGPIRQPFASLLPPHKLRGLDLSPMLAIIVLQVVQRILVNAGL